jgi:1-acyl-sn-glycerol-3-phosphate acyltransferase
MLPLEQRGNINKKVGASMAKKSPTFEKNQVPKHLRGNRSAFTRWFGKSFLRFFGWRVEGSIANAERVLITAAPHTSNWDAVLGLAAVLGLNVRLHFLGKHTIFIPGLKWFMRWLGGIPVNRQNPEGIIDHVNQLVGKHEGIVIVIAPEGTRKKAEKWKTGFLRIAEASQCKIQMGALDFVNKRIVLGDMYEPTGDNQADIKNIKQWYSQYKGKFPEQF